MVKIHKPIVVVGTGRCGSTMLHRILARHKDVGWLSTFNEVLPSQTWLSGFANLYRKKAFEKIKHETYFPKPFECYKFWEYYLPGFSRRDKPQTAADVPTKAIEPVRRAVARVLKYEGRSRFLVKVTGWSRVEYFDRIFPDAIFVFLNREHRSVVSSWVQAGWLDVTSELDTKDWQWGEVPDEYRQIWQQLGGGPLLSAAVKIQLDLDDIRKNTALFPKRSREFQYEEIISQPKKYLREMVDFCELEWDSQFDQEISSMKFYNPTNKWKEYLTEEQGERVLEFFKRVEDLELA
jgi:hypothetical protein